MTTVASQITSLAVVYSTVYSDADQRKHQSCASLAFVWGIHRDRWIPRTKGQLRGKCFHLMTSSWRCYGITDDACTLLMSYLSQRKQRLKIGRSRGYWGNLSHGVPQGSILGPLIFNIFLNDVFHVLDKQCSLYNYVDDNTLVNSDAYILSLKSKLEKSANMASNWFANNHMKSNFSKFQAMILNNHPDSCEISLSV